MATFSSEFSASLALGDEGVMGNTLTLTPDNLEYTVERWTPKEIVAFQLRRYLPVRNVLKFDLVEKRGYYSQALSDPVDSKMPKMSKDICSASE